MGGPDLLPQEQLDRALRHARRATWLALAALAVALLAGGALAVVLANGGGSKRTDARIQDAAAAGRAGTVRIAASRLGSPSGTGSGWVLDGAQGLIATAAHVINEGDAFAVTLAGRTVPADVLAMAPCEDLAVLRLRHPVQGMSSLALAKGVPGQGAAVVALGFPGGGPLTATTGVVTVPRTAYDDPSPELPRMAATLQTDADVNPGNSGGPLMDLDGRVAGVDVASRVTGAGGRRVSGENFAIASDRALAVLDGLRRGISSDWLGLTFGYPSANELALQQLPPGLIVTGAVEDTPAARDGLPRSVEQVLAIDGRPVGTTLAGYCAAIGRVRSGDSVTLTVTHGAGRGQHTVVVQAA